MAMQDWKSVYSRIFWKNKREGGTPLNEANLNTSDIALKEIDNRILELRDAKFGKAEANVLIKDWNIDEKTGIITVTWLNNTTKVYDLNIEKIPVSFVMSNDGIITMTTADGTEFKTDLKKAIPIYTFKGSATIKVTPSIGESGDKVYTFDIVDGSIDGTKLNPDYLAQINTSVGNASNYAESAQTSATAAATSETNAKASEVKSKEYMEKAFSGTPGGYSALVDEVNELNSNLVEQKMLGWTVPSECPIQNYVDSDGVFHQRVGRVDLGSIGWHLDSETQSGVGRFASAENAFDMGKEDAIAYCSKGYSYNKYATSDKTYWFDLPRKVLYIQDNTYKDAEAFKNAMQGVYLYYELAEEKTISVDGNEAITKINDSLGTIGKCKNLLNPTLQTTEQNGVTCTANGDGTYTLNGTASEPFSQFTIGKITLPKGTYKIIGNPKIISCELYISGINYPDIGNGAIIEVEKNIENYNVFFYIPKDTTLSNAVLKPIITTNLNATYDDFVPYTGEGETLTHDVAEIKNDLSDEWTSKTYSVGDYCIYKNSMWRCLVANSVAPSEGSNWTRVTIGSELKRIISMIN